MSRRFSPVVLCAAVAGTACHGQVFRVAGAADSGLRGATGAALSMYAEGETSTVGLALQNGLHLGARREVQTGNSTLAIGDGSIELPLPSDLEATPRSFLARGLLVQRGTAGTVVFAGFTGPATANSLITAVLPSRFIGVLSSTVALGHVSISTLLTHGVRNNTLVSVSHERNPFWRTAITVGRSESHTIVRTLASMQRSTFRFAVCENLGNLQLQPSIGNQESALERIGLNVLASRSLGRHLTMEAARHSYSTASVGGSALYQGVTAPRSQLIEGGVTLHAGSMQAQVRALNATSGPGKTRGSIASIAWTAQRWSLQAMLLQSRLSGPGTSGSPSGTRSLDLRAAHQVFNRLQLQETASFGGGSSAATVGGSWTGDRLGVSVSHQQVFVPFGMRSGFHSVLLVSARLRIGGNEVSTSVTSGGGLPTAVLLSTDGYYGAVPDAAVPQDRPVHLPRYAVLGHVRTPAGEPLRGAAVRIGSSVVYTDSEGQFLTRLDRDHPVPVHLLAEQFLSAEKFQDRSGQQWVKPSREGGDVLLSAERCTVCLPAVQGANAPSVMQGHGAGQPAREGAITRATKELRLLAARMFTWHNKRTAVEL